MNSTDSSPLAHAVIPSKQKARRHYGSHPYFTKRAWNVVQAYIKHFSSPGETVLDPFGGSGVTAVESLVLHRKAVYCDISSWACFLARQTAIAPVNLGQLQDAFGEVEDRCRGFLERIWSVPNNDLEHRPVRDWYPRSVPLPENSDVATVEELFTPRMLHGLAALHSAIVHIEPVPTRALLLLAFSATLARINRTFLSTTDRKESRGGSAIFSIYRYKVARQPVELPLWPQFARRFRRLLDAKRETNDLIGNFYREGDSAIIRQGSALRLDEWLSAESVDYVYTDPPYGGHIAYLDLSTMWAAWLGLPIQPEDREDEVIEGGQLHKTRGDYERLLAVSLEQIHRVLKRGRWLSLVFVHRDASLWDGLVRACRETGFTYVNTVVQPVGVVWSMHKKKNPLRVLSGELVLNFRKERGRGRVIPVSTKADPVGTVRDSCIKKIFANCGASTEDLHHAVIPCLLEKGLLSDFARSHADLTPLLHKFFEFDQQDRRWHLKQETLLACNATDAEKLRYLITRLLRIAADDGRTMTESVIKKALRSQLNGSVKINNAILNSVLEQIACCLEDKSWSLLPGKLEEQPSLF